MFPACQNRLMLGETRIRLELRDPDRNMFRDYELTYEEDLFGFPMVTIWYGRSGTRGRQSRKLVSSREEGLKVLIERLRARSTAERRLGASYRLVDLVGSAEAKAELAPLLGGFKPACRRQAFP